MGRHGQVHALRLDPHEHWKLAGVVHVPPLKAAVIDVALSTGRVLILDADGGVSEMNVTTGGWRKPVKLPATHRWTGICGLPDKNAWLGLGVPAEKLRQPEFWQ